MAPLFLIVLFGCNVKIILSITSDWHPGKYLRYIDRHIVKILNKPEQSKGQLLLDFMGDYVEYFEGFRDKVRKKRRDVFEAVDFMVENNGPQFILKNVSDIETNVLFGNDTEKLKTFVRKIKNTKLLWSEFQLDVVQLKL